MKHIDIKFEENEGNYSCKCPFCGDKLILPDGNECEHVLYAYEEVNQMPLHPAPDWMVDVLVDKPFDFLELFQDRWETDYMPDPEDLVSEEELMEEKRCAAKEYCENWITLNDVMKILNLPEYQHLMDKIVIAQTEENLYNGQTSYLFIENRELE